MEENIVFLIIGSVLTLLSSLLSTLGATILQYYLERQKSRRAELLVIKKKRVEKAEEYLKKLYNHGCMIYQFEIEHIGSIKNIPKTDLDNYIKFSQFIKIERSQTETVKFLKTQKITKTQIRKTLSNLKKIYSENQKKNLVMSTEINEIMKDVHLLFAVGDIKVYVEANKLLNLIQNETEAATKLTKNIDSNREKIIEYEKNSQKFLSNLSISYGQIVKMVDEMVVK